MKIAKRALAIIMAVALVGCMSAMAFAAGSVDLAYDGDKNISITANGLIGMKSFDFIFTASEGVVLKNVKASADAAACTAADNAFTTEKNMAEGKFSGYFKENLWTLDKWQAAADDLGEEIPGDFDPTSFDMGTIVVDASGAKGDAYVTVTGVIKTESGDVNVDEKVALSAEEPATEAPKTEAPKTEAPKTEAPKTEAPKTEAPKTEAPKTEAPKTEAPKTEAPKTEAPKTEAPKTEAPKTEAPKTEAPKTTVKPVNAGDTQKDGGTYTGDNMALAAAASVVALAGAAFVITKKRK